MNDEYYSPEQERKTVERYATIKIGPMTIALIVLNVLVYIAEATVLREKVSLLCNTPLVFQTGEYYRLLTSMFAHGSIDHLASNMIALAGFGGMFEKKMNKWGYLTLYIVCGALTGLVSNMWRFTIGDIDAMSLGASGAIFGLTGAFIALSRYGYFPKVPTRNIILLIAISLESGLVNRTIDLTGHIAGFIVGSLAGIAIGSLLNSRRTE